MRYSWKQNVFLTLLLLTGCGDSQSPRVEAVPGGGGSGSRSAYVSEGSPYGRSDAERVRSADISVLFVGNSHTMFQDLPDLVCKMVQFLRPGKEVHAHVVAVGFLEQVAQDPRCREEIESRPWKYVVLQAQKISASG